MSTIVFIVGTVPGRVVVINPALKPPEILFLFSHVVPGNQVHAANEKLPLVLIGKPLGGVFLIDLRASQAHQGVTFDKRGSSGSMSEKFIECLPVLLPVCFMS